MDLIRKLCEQAENDTNDPSSAATTGNFEENVKSLLSNAVSVFVPDRIDKKTKFLKTAKEIGEEHLIDLTISVHGNHVAAMYSLECDFDFHCLKR